MDRDTDLDRELPLDRELELGRLTEGREDELPERALLELPDEDFDPVPSF